MQGRHRLQIVPGRPFGQVRMILPGAGLWSFENPTFLDEARTI